MRYSVSIICSLAIIHQWLSEINGSLLRSGRKCEATRGEVRIEPGLVKGTNSSTIGFKPRVGVGSLYHLHITSEGLHRLDIFAVMHNKNRGLLSIILLVFMKPLKCSLITESQSWGHINKGVSNHVGNSTDQIICTKRIVDILWRVFNWSGGPRSI